MKYKAVRKIVYSQIIFGITLLVCYMLWPASNGELHALSDYGTSLPTAVPYAAGFLAVMALMFGAARDLPQTTDVNRKLSKIFVALALALPVLVATPYTWNTFLFVVHMGAGGFLYVTELVVAVWLATRLFRDRINLMLVGLQLTGGLAMFFALDQIGVLHAQNVVFGQALALVAFSLLLVRVVLRIEKVHYADIGLE